MKTVIVTCYRGYSHVIGQMSLEEFIQRIRGNDYRRSIEAIQAALTANDTMRADRIKRQLPYFTLTAVYAERRLPYSLTLYQNARILDFDEMTADDIVRTRRIAEADKATLACALSPRRHGLKLLVSLQTDEARLEREAFEAKGTASYAELEQYHKRMFELEKAHYEQLLGCKVDTSGSDLARGMYATYDPEAFYSPERVEALQPLHITLTLPEPETAEKSAPKKRGRKPLPQPTGNGTETENIDPLTQLEFRKAVDYTRRKFRFEPGSRDSFIYCLGARCRSRHIDEEDALRMTLKKYGNEPDFDAEPPLRNGYRYSSKNEETDEENKKSPVERVMEYLRVHYRFRRNVVLDRVEFAKLIPGTDERNLSFLTMRGKDFNTIYTELQLARTYCPLATLRAVIDSDFAPDYNPFEDYFLSLPAWDGTTDYIRQLADCVETDDPEFWHESLRRRLVGLVACAIDDESQNQQLLLLYSRQGKGKSRFIRNLLPPPLRTYYRNGMLNPDNKDHMLMLSTCLIINLEEFDGVSASRLADLKRIITQEKVTERKVYDTQAHTFVRRASFAASTNNPHCLQDIGENRRMLFNSVRSIDYHREVNHAGIYAQALALWRSGYHYWYEGDEVELLNLRNEAFRLREPIEEHLFVYYRIATEADYYAKWLSASELMSKLTIYAHIQANRATLQTLVTVLENHGFRSRTTDKGMTEYAVVELEVRERHLS